MIGASIKLIVVKCLNAESKDDNNYYIIYKTD